MHILLAILGSIVTILVLFKRLSDAGIDIGWLNPFAWRRRRAWRKQYQGNPIFSLYEPLEVAALLATTTAKIDGDLSSDEKTKLLGLFQSEFHRSEKEASDLLMSSIYLFGDGQDAIAKPEKVISSSLDKFDEDKARSVMKLLNEISQIEPKNQDAKQKFIAKVEKVFSAKFQPESGW